MIKLGSIKAQMLVVAILPMLLVSFGLGAYFINQRVNDTDEALAKQGETLAELLAVTVEFGLLTGSITMLEGQLRQPLAEPDVADIVVLDSNFFEVVRGGESGIPVRISMLNSQQEGEYMYFLSQVYASGVAFDDMPFDEAEEPELLGWVAVIMSREPAKLRKYEIIETGLSLLLLCLAIGIALGLHFGRNMVHVLSRLIAIMKEVELGRGAKRADTHKVRGDLRNLAVGFNQMVDRVEESKDSLNARIERATQDLRNSKDSIERKNKALLKARERAERANVAKDEFLARMSHELRTPLTSVLGFTRLLAKTTLDPDQQQFSRIITEASSMLLTVIDDILDFSKLESNAITLEKTSFCLLEQVRGVVEMMTPIASSKKLELVMIIDPDLEHKVVGDPARFRQVIANLLSNAVKFTDSGEVIIQLFHQGRSDNTQWVSVEIIDSGIGIARSKVNNLFKAFSQADTSITRRYGGSGLGLVISKHLVDLMGGGLKVDSVEGEGTEAKFSVPLQLSADNAIEPPVSLARVVLFDPHSLSRKAIRYQLYRVASDVVVANSHSSLLASLDVSTEVVIVSVPAGESLDLEYISWLEQIRRVHKGLIVMLNNEPCELPKHLAISQLRKPINPNDIINLLSNHEVIEGSPDCSQEEISFTGALKVLVAEDNSFNQLYLKNILDSVGIDIIQVITGDEAVLCAEEFNPDLIIMDVHMPEKDGIEATALIRQAGYDKPILALTANVVEREHQALMQAGVNEVLLKPIDDQLLLSRIAHYKGSRIKLAEQQDGLLDTLERYKISKHTLHLELEQQVADLMLAYRDQSCERMRTNTHQLIGIAGLYDMPELDVVSCDLNDAVKTDDFKHIWGCLWRLKRLIDHEQYY